MHVNILTPVTLTFTSDPFHPASFIVFWQLSFLYQLRYTILARLFFKEKKSWCCHHSGVVVGGTVVLGVVVVVVVKL